jgi:uncharacterized membrane protein
MRMRVRAHFGIGWQRFNTSRRVFLISTLALLASWASLEVAVVALQRGGVALNVALHLGFLVLFSGLMVGIHRIALDVVDGQPPTLNGLTRVLHRAPGFLLAASLYSLGAVAGLLLFVVPGVYVAVRYALFGHALADGDKSAVEALREAGDLSRSRWWSVCRFLALLLACNLAGAALLGLGLLVSFPVSLVASASFFRTLQQMGSREPA